MSSFYNIIANSQKNTCGLGMVYGYQPPKIFEGEDKKFLEYSCYHNYVRKFDFPFEVEASRYTSDVFPSKGDFVLALRSIVRECVSAPFFSYRNVNYVRKYEENYVSIKDSLGRLHPNYRVAYYRTIDEDIFSSIKHHLEYLNSDNEYSKERIFEGDGHRLNRNYHELDSIIKNAHQKVTDHMIDDFKELERENIKLREVLDKAKTDYNSCVEGGEKDCKKELSRKGEEIINEHFWEDINNNNRRFDCSFKNSIKIPTKMKFYAEDNKLSDDGKISKFLSMEHFELRGQDKINKFLHGIYYNFQNILQELIDTWFGEKYYMFNEIINDCGVSGFKFIDKHFISNMLFERIFNLTQYLSERFEEDSESLNKFYVKTNEIMQEALICLEKGNGKDVCLKELHENRKLSLEEHYCFNQDRELDAHSLARCIYKSGYNAFELHKMNLDHGVVSFADNAWADVRYQVGNVFQRIVNSDALLKLSGMISFSVISFLPLILNNIQNQGVNQVNVNAPLLVGLAGLTRNANAENYYDISFSNNFEEGDIEFLQTTNPDYKTEVLD